MRGKLKTSVCICKIRNHFGDFGRLDPIPSLGCMIYPDVKALVGDLTFFKEQGKSVKSLLGVDSTFTPEEIKENDNYKVVRIYLIYMNRFYLIV